MPTSMQGMKTVIASLLRQAPGHWTDTKHEEDGGGDVRGYRAQEGRQLLRSFVSGLNNWAAWDDVTGGVLESSMVKEVRAIEMKYFEKMNVYTRVPRSHQTKTNGKIIKVR